MMESRKTAVQPGAGRVGQTVGKYRLHGILGAGGMSTVYAATHRNGFAVAIKMLHPHLASDESISRWFRREGKLANIVSHPGAVRVHDDDVTDDGVPYLVVERLYGEALRAIWERGGKKLEPREVAVIAYDALDVLAAAHARGLVHRDVKPDNLYLTEDGELKLLDFGIAHALPVVGQGASMATARIVGTPAFMAPEQARGIDVRAETDIWGVGATMFAMLTGEHVHAKAAPPDLLLWAATRPPPAVREVAHELPLALANVIDRALAFESTDRFATAAAMRTALAEAYRQAFGESLGETRETVLAGLKGRLLGATRVVTETVAIHSVATQQPPRSGLTAMRGAVTRTLAYVEPTMPRSFLKRFAFAAAVLGATIAGVGIARTRIHPSGSTLPLGPATGVQATAHDDETALTAAPERFTPSAIADYDAAIQLWRDASSHDSISRIEAAVESAPDFAAAHLWYVLSGTPSGKAREHYQAAVEQRHTLNALQIEVLDAIQPETADPPNRLRATEQLAEVARTHTRSVELALALAQHYERLDDREHGNEVLDRVLALPHPPALALFLRARLTSLTVPLDNDSAATIGVLQRCIEASPSSTDCIYELSRIDTHEGRCFELERLARQAKARQPHSVFPYTFLADALFASGASPSALRSLFDERDQLLTGPRREKVRRRDAVRLAIASGHLAEAQALAETLKETTFTTDLAEDRAVPYEFLIRILIERGPLDAAKRVAREFVVDAAHWTESENFDVASEGMFLRSLVGDLSAEERVPVRQKILVAAEAPSYGPPYRGWLNAYISGAWTPDEAKLALSRAPERPLPGPQYMDADGDYELGRIFALAGDSNRAIQFFRRAARMCAIGDDYARTQAKLALALLLDETRAPSEETCTLYRDVATHWKDSPESRTLQRARERFSSNKCTDPELPLSQ